MLCKLVEMSYSPYSSEIQKVTKDRANPKNHLNKKKNDSKKRVLKRPIHEVAFGFRLKRNAPPNQSFVRFGFSLVVENSPAG